ncbi:MAG: hypothetical protein ACE5LH_06990 [Fidelibacterota bacterium]
MRITEMIIISLFGATVWLVCEDTLWRGWPAVAERWGWKQWLKWFMYPGFYLGLAFVFFMTLAVMKTVRDLWFQPG